MVTERSRATQLTMVQTGRIIYEQQPLLKKLRLLLLFNPIMEWLDTTQAMRVHMHKKSETEGALPISQGKVAFAKANIMYRTSGRNAGISGEDQVFHRYVWH